MDEPWDKVHARQVVPDGLGQEPVGTYVDNMYRVGADINTQRKYRYLMSSGDQDWMFRSFPDGTEQWQYMWQQYPPVLFIERVVGTKDEGWRIVKRTPPEEHTYTMHPPCVSGPYPTLEGAKAAFRLIAATGGLTAHAT